MQTKLLINGEPVEGAGEKLAVLDPATAEYVADHTSMIRRDPVDPVAAITPWNYPSMMAAWKIAVGCTVSYPSQYGAVPNLGRSA